MRKEKTYRMDEPIRNVRSVVKHHLQWVNTPKSLAIFMILDHTDRHGGCDDEILALQPDPHDYNSFEEFSNDFRVVELLRKSTLLRLSTDPEKVALENFNSAEDRCSNTNRKLAYEIGDLDPRFVPLLERARRALRSLLPAVDSELLSSLIDEGGWGKGVTSSCKGMWLSEYHKLRAKPQATRAFAPLAKSIMNDVSSTLWTSEIEVVEGSKCATVPKDSRTHRTIAVEPSMNLYLQLGIGRKLKSLLRRKWALDLTTQSRNQDLALQGSIDGSFATIDLSSASDTVSRRIVELLLPDDWVRLLNSCRSSFTEVNGEKRLLSKWSSMGNGYTFELETLIFSALVRAVIPLHEWYSNQWAVYGDDIIVRSQWNREICELLEYCGFQLNQRKTYATSYFRESCGANCWFGKPVRTYRLKKGDKLDLLNWRNWITNWCPGYRLPDSAEKLLGDIPIVPLGSGLIGLEEAEDHPFFADLRLKRFGYPIYQLVFVPRKFSREKVEGGEAVLAHLRFLRRKRLDSDSRWLITATNCGQWVRKKTYF